MSNQFEIDTSEVEKMFSEFDGRKRKAVYRRATKDALNIVKKETLQNLKGEINPKMFSKKDKWGNSFRTGVVVKVGKSGKTGVIHIMKNFKLRFYELGTQYRYHKNGRYIGRIRKTRFFTRAKQSKEREVFNSINRLISDSIKRINEKYNNRQL